MLCNPSSPITCLSEPEKKKVQPPEKTSRGCNSSRKSLIFLLFLALGPLAGCGGGGGGGTGETASASPTKSSAESSSYRIETDHPLYSLTVLGDLGTDNWAVSLNENSQIVGNYQTANGSTHVFLWETGGMSTLVDSAQASAINASGEVVGWMEDAGSQAAFLHNGRLLQLDPAADSSKAYAINELAEIVGLQIQGTRQAFLDNGGQLDIIAPEITGYAASLNNVGQVVIQKETAEGSRALLLENDTLTDLGTLGGDSTQVTDINDAGQVVGWSLTAEGEYHAILWQDGVMIDLAEAVGGTFCSAVAINDAGQVLIKSKSPRETSNLIWDAGEVTDLGNLGVDYAVVNDMNDAGEIVGWMLTGDGEMRAFLATPKG